jgi:hypothetical protein
MGFAYWAAFLLVLEPGNVLRAHHGGHQLAFSHEAVRITGAALLGTLAMPAVLFLTRRFPLRGRLRLRNTFVHAVCAVAMALGLIVVSCFLAAWGFEGRASPSVSAVLDQLWGNWLLLAFGIAALTAIAHLVVNPAQAPGSAPRTTLVRGRIAVRARGRLTYVDWSNVDWIETQGNYLALRVGGACHLVRATAAGIAQELDAAEFVRVHRRAIVAVSRVRTLRALPNGDAILTLAGGQEVRVSRRYRAALMQAWRASVATQIADPKADIGCDSKGSSPAG